MSRSRDRLGGPILAGLMVASLPGMGMVGTVPEAPAPAAAARADAARPVYTGSLARSLARGADALRTELERTLADVRAVPSEGSTISAGSDGRLTVLLLGSDHRAGYRPPEHTDVIMVVSLDLATKRLAMASVPRDVVYFPIHEDNRMGSKNTGTMRVNLLYDRYKTQDYGIIEPGAMERFKKDVAFALRMEIDYFSYTRFTGFDALMDNVGGVSVDIPARIKDTEYQDSASPPYGIKFPAASGWTVHGAQAERCSGTVMKCKRGIVYVRSRKGYVGSVRNSEPSRVRRQQQLVLAAIRKVASGTDSGLSSLSSASVSHITTSLPTEWADVTWLRDRLKDSVSYSTDRIVFTPTTYATALTTPKYSSKLKLKAVRAWIAQHMG